MGLFSMFDKKKAPTTTTTAIPTFSDEEAAARGTIFGAANNAFQTQNALLNAPANRTSPENYTRILQGAKAEKDPLEYLYKNLLGRSADETGRASWSTMLGKDPTGAYADNSLQAIMGGLVESGEYGDYQKALAAADPFTNPLAKPVGPSEETTRGQVMAKSGAGDIYPAIFQGSKDLQGATDYAKTAAANLDPTLATGRSAIEYGLTGATDVNNNPALQAAIDAALRGLGRNYTDPNGVLANIRSDSIQAGQYGGTRQGLGEGVAAGRYLTEAGDIAAQMANEAYRTGQQTFSSTLNAMPGFTSASLNPAAMMSTLAPRQAEFLSSTGMQPSQIYSAIGAQQEGYQQQQEDYDAGGREFQANKGFLPVQNYANLINATTVPGATSTNSVAFPKMTTGAKVDAGLGAAFSLLGMFV